MIACANSLTPQTGVTVIPLSTAPIAARASPSSGTSPTIGPRRPWPLSNCARIAEPSTMIRWTGAFTLSPMPARCADPRWSCGSGMLKPGRIVLNIRGMKPFGEHGPRWPRAESSRSKVWVAFIWLAMRRTMRPLPYCGSGRDGWTSPLP